MRDEADSKTVPKEEDSDWLRKKEKDAVWSRASWWHIWKGYVFYWFPVRLTTKTIEQNLWTLLKLCLTKLKAWK